MSGKDKFVKINTYLGKVRGDDGIISLKPIRPTGLPVDIEATLQHQPFPPFLRVEQLMSFSTSLEGELRLNIGAVCANTGWDGVDLPFPLPRALLAGLLGT